MARSATTNRENAGSAGILPVFVWAFSWEYAIELVRRPNGSAASNGTPDFASEPYRPPADITSLKAHRYHNSLDYRPSARESIFTTVIIRTGRRVPPAFSRRKDTLPLTSHMAHDSEEDHRPDGASTTLRTC